MSQNCCYPGQDEKASPGGESSYIPMLSSNRGEATQTSLCPTCGQKGKRVGRITLKSLLGVSLLVLHDGSYFFCRTATCPVVYFAADGLQAFTKEQIRVSVYQKEPDDESVLVCYCFYHSPATIRAEFLATGRSMVIEEINAGIGAGQCACEIRNPQGSCCLGNVRAVMNQKDR